MESKLTIITIAQNESSKIARCIESCRGLGRHIVVDGGSEDDTVAVARDAGAEVIERPFRYPADQYNFGIQSATTPWVFILDADERMDSALRACLSRVANKAPSVSAVAFSVNRRNFVFGKWLRHGGWYPDFNVRLLSREHCRYEDREVHARIVSPKGWQVQTLDGHIDHDTYGSVDQYLTKLNRFTNREVLARRRPRESTELHATLRRIWLCTPMRPVTKFIIEYVFKAGWRDGRLGFDMAVMSAVYEFVVGMKQRERSSNSGCNRATP